MCCVPEFFLWRKWNSKKPIVSSLFGMLQVSLERRGNNWFCWVSIFWKNGNSTKTCFPFGAASGLTRKEKVPFVEPPIFPEKIRNSTKPCFSSHFLVLEIWKENQNMPCVDSPIFSNKRGHIVNGWIRGGKTDICWVPDFSKKRRTQQNHFFLLSGLHSFLIIYKAWVGFHKWFMMS